MKINSIKSHLQPYSITKKRQTTINHAFASAIAPNDSYEEFRIKEALEFLGQNPNGHLSCFYCDHDAETWDHVFGLVKNYKYSGYGHVIGNLLPCCKKCNSEKGNKNWENFLNAKVKSNAVRSKKIKLLKKYFKKYLPLKTDYEKIKSICPGELKRLELIKSQIIHSIKMADAVAGTIRSKIEKYQVES